MTLVTGLFDLARRERSARHSVRHYVAASDWLMGLDRDLVVFCDPELATPITRRRRAAGLADRTTVIPRALEDLAAHDQLEAIRAARERNPVHNASAVKDTPLFTAFVWAKFALVAEAIDSLPGEGPVAWIDFGLAGRPHPDDDPFAGAGPSIRVQMLQPLSTADVADRRAYYAHFHGHIAGGFISGGRAAWLTLAALVSQQTATDLAAGLAPSDEQLLAVLCAAHPSLFSFRHGGYGELLPNAVHLRGGATNLAMQLRRAREPLADGAERIGPSGHELCRRILHDLDAGILEASGAPLAALLDECFMAAYYGAPGEPALAAHVRDLYLDAALHDPEFRDVFLLSELRIRGNFAFVGS
jgi:hypothetical protein